MSNIYYPESWMQHPEVLRLQQLVRELERKLKSEDYLIDNAKADKDKASSCLASKIREVAYCEARLKATEDKVRDLEQQIETFNQSSFIRKATFHFIID